MVHLSTHNICFGWKIRKLFLCYTLLTKALKSTFIMWAASTLRSFLDWLMERRGSVVECLTRDRGVAGSSLIGVTALCTWARHIRPTLKINLFPLTRPCFTGMGRSVKKLFNFFPKFDTHLNLIVNSPTIGNKIKYRNNLLRIFFQDYTVGQFSKFANCQWIKKKNSWLKIEINFFG